jgi:hypothetical protein
MNRAVSIPWTKVLIHKSVVVGEVRFGEHNGLKPDTARLARPVDSGLDHLLDPDLQEGKAEALGLRGQGHGVLASYHVVELRGSCAEALAERAAVLLFGRKSVIARDRTQRRSYRGTGQQHPQRALQAPLQNGVAHAAERLEQAVEGRARQRKTFLQ